MEETTGKKKIITINDKKEENFEVKPALKFFARQNLGNVGFQLFEVEEKNCGHQIPPNVDAEEYLINYNQMLDRLENSNQNIQQRQEQIPLSAMQRAEEKTEKKEILEMDDVCNYVVKPCVRVCYFDRNGKEDMNMQKIECLISIDRKPSKKFEIFTKDISRLTRIIAQKFSTAIINWEEKIPEKVIENRFRERTKAISSRTVYIDYGWQIINGKSFYIFKSLDKKINADIITEMDLPYVQCNRDELTSVILRALNLYKEKSIMHTLFSYSMLGVLYKLFDEVDLAPHFLLFINGKTGSLKTTISKILFVQLAENSNRKFPRRIDADTVTSFERAIVKKGRDTVMLIDDYAPAKTSSKRSDMQNKLESIIRMVGDGSTKSRSNPDLQDIQGEGVHGVVALTGELRGKGLSSNLRCLYCAVNRENVNLETVTWFQQNSNAFTTVIYYFIEYISQNWSSILQYITSTFQIYRDNTSKIITEKRLVDSVVTLSIVCDIFTRFLLQYSNLAKSSCIELNEEMKNSVILNAKYSQQEIEDEEPSIVFLQALDDLMKQNNITLFKKEKFRVNPVADGFEDENYLYFVPDKIYAKVCQMLKTINVFYAFDLRETVVSLHELGFIQSTPNGEGKKTYYARIEFGDGKKYKFLKISKNKFLKVFDNNFKVEV